MSKDAMKLALEALKKAQRQCHYYNIAPHLAYEDAIKAIEEALVNHIPNATKMVSGVKDSLTTQQEQGEPVAWYREEDGEKIYYATKAWDDCLPLYTTPQQRKPLTDEQIDFLNFLYGAGEWDGVWFEQKHPIEKGVFWWRKHMKRLFDYNVKENT